MTEGKPPLKQRTPGYLVGRFADRTSVIGPTYISTSHHTFSKGFWTIVFIAAIGMTIYMVTSNFLRFFSWPVKTEISLGYTQLAFPMITICNTNSIRVSELARAGPEMREFLEELNPAAFERRIEDENEEEEEPPSNETSPPSMNGTTPPTVKRRRKRYIDKYQQNARRNSSFVPDGTFDVDDGEYGETAPQFEVERDFQYLMSEIPRETTREMGHQLEQMLVYCSFEGKSCNESNFTLFQTNEYGNCYKFNDGLTKKVNIAKRTGNTYGLQLIMYLEVDEYVKGLTLGYGMRVALSPAKTLPSISSEGLFVSAGAETSIGVQLLNISRLGTPYTNCSLENGNEFLNKMGVVYTRAACFETCEARTVLEKCGCYARGIEEKYPQSVLNSTSKCKSSDNQCVNAITQDSLDNKLECDCPTACNESVYQTSSSSREWPEEDYLFSIIDAVCRDRVSMRKCNSLINMTEAQRRRNFLKLNVYYRDLNYEVISQSADYPSSSFFSDLGGSIGLWLGISVLGLLEVIQLCMELIYSCFTRGNRRREVSDSPDKQRGDYEGYEKDRQNNAFPVGVYDMNHSNSYNRK